MKVLQIANKSPYPPNEGGPMAMHAITKGLIMHGHSVKVLCMNTPKNNISAEEIPDDYKTLVDYESVYVDNRVKPIPAFLNLFSRSSYNISRFVSKKFRQKIEELLQKQQFDIVILESIYIAPYINTVKKYHPGKILIRAHNIEFRIWERLSDNELNPLKRVYLRYLTRKLKRYELHTIKYCDGLIAITEIDKNFFQSRFPDLKVIAIPFAVEQNSMGDVSFNNNNPPLFYHLGSMNWMPNIEAVQWLLKTVWPEVENNNPEAKLFIAGHHMPKEFFETALNNVVIMGKVESASDFISTKDVLLAPIFSGSGIRIKILEAMSEAKLVITTSIGAEGIDYKDGSHLIIANDTESFINKILEVCLNPEQVKLIGINARRLIEEKYELSAVTGRLEEFIHSFAK